MARDEYDREDLLREAVALVERAELRLPGVAEPVFIGFRRDGSASIYFGSDTAYQFNARGELRRAYDGGLLYKAERGRLVSLDRQRLPHEVRLLRHDLSDDEAARFLAALAQRVVELRERIRGGIYEIVGQEPTGGDVLGRIARWLNAVELPPRFAAAPNARFCS